MVFEFLKKMEISTERKEIIFGITLKRIAHSFLDNYMHLFFFPHCLKGLARK